MSDATTRNLVKITEARFEECIPSATYHKVWVGNDEDGWVEVPYVTNVDCDLRQSEIRKAVITVMFPKIDFTGGPPSVEK